MVSFHSYKHFNFSSLFGLDLYTFKNRYKFYETLRTHKLFTKMFNGLYINYVQKIRA